MTLANPLRDVTAFQAHAKVANPDLTPAREFIIYLRALENCIQLAIDGLEAQTTPTTVSQLPTASTVPGARYIVTDATTITFAGTLTGGGVEIVPVYSNGTGWKIG